MKNGLIGEHIATGQPVQIELTEEELHLDCWDTAMGIVHERTGIEVIGNIQIDYLVVDGVRKVFH